LGLKTVGWVTVPCIGNVVIPAVGDSTVGVAAAAAAWNVPGNNRAITNSLTIRCLDVHVKYLDVLINVVSLRTDSVIKRLDVVVSLRCNITE